MQWLIEEVFRPAVDIAQMLAEARWNPADVLSTKAYHDARDRLKAGLERPDVNKTLQGLPLGEVHRAVQDLQLVTREFETMFDSSTALAIGQVLYIDGRQGWLALLHHLPPGVPAPPRDALPSMRPKPPVHPVRTAADGAGGYAEPEHRPVASPAGAMLEPAGLATTPLELPTRPPDKAFQAWQIRELVGISKQTEIARMMTEQGVPATQGQVSKWLTAVDEWRTAGGLMPEVGTLKGGPQSVAPDILDMGAREDRLTPRQRLRRDSDADE